MPIDVGPASSLTTSTRAVLQTPAGCRTPGWSVPSTAAGRGSPLHAVLRPAPVGSTGQPLGIYIRPISIALANGLRSPRTVG